MGRPFSNIGIDQIYDQNSKLVKTERGTVDVISNSSTALIKWMLLNP